MTTHPGCDDATRRDNAERYAAGRMTPAEAEAFEDHYVACEACQQEVRLASAIASTLSDPAKPVSRGRSSRRLWIAGSLATAAGIAAIIMLPSGANTSLAALGAVADAPAYTAIPVRGASADSAFDRAMASYAARDYRAASTGLRALLARGGDALPARFFLGVSELMAGDTQSAERDLDVAVALGDTPYRSEARYYRAKALLRMGRAEDARAELARLTPADGPTYAMGAALADSIARAR